MPSLGRTLRIIRRQGLRFLYLNFTQRLLFDLRHGTDTAKALPKEDYEFRPSAFQSGNEYSGAFTSEITWAFRELHGRLGPRLGDYYFADVGCGKGKVLVAWTLQLDKAGIEQRTVGIEYYEPLLEVAGRNFRKVHRREPNLRHADAGAFPYRDLGSRAIFFLYNPFGEQVMSSFLHALSGVEAYVVYNNPAHAEVLAAAGFKLVAQKAGRHVNERTMVFHREANAQ